MVVLIDKDKASLFNNYSELFQSISEEGKVIESITDNTILLSDKSTLRYGEVIGSVDKFKEEVNIYRNELKDSISKLKKQGIEIPKKELEKLSEQFKFVK